MLEISLKEIFNIIVMSVLFTLIVYHLFIYIGRKDKEERYNVYFSLFAFFMMTYIFFTSELRKYIYPNELYRHLISPPVTCFTYVLMMIFAYEVFKILLKYKAPNKKALIPFYFPFALQIISMSTSYIVGYDYYINHLYFITTITASIGPIYLITILIKWIINKKLYKDRAVQITFGGWLILAIDFLLEEMLPSFGVKYPLRGAYLGSGLSVLVYAFALAERFNNEHRELKILKNKLEEKVKERTNELEIANEQKTIAFINLAHETRTPATLIDNYIKKCVQKYPNDRDILIVKQNIDKLVRDMINFLDAEKIEQGRLLFEEMHEINVTEYLNEKAELISVTVESKGINLIKELDENIYITSNIHALDRIINNLLDNAIRYTPKKGKIHVYLKDISEKEIRIIVADTGEGIPDELQSHIFDKYYQISHTKGNNQGMGMGLYITKSIIDILGGSVILESNRKETRFIVNLPKNKNIMGEKPNKVEKYSTKLLNCEIDQIKITQIDKNKDNVLVVEDNNDLMCLINDALYNEYNIFCAENGLKALEILSEYKINLIVSDIMMDTMDGYELLKKVKESKEYTKIPFVFLTAKTGIKEEIKGLNCGAIEYIQKPFSMDALKARVQSIIEFEKVKQKLYEMDKYTSVGKMTASICHEIINPLSGIKGPLYVIEQNANNKEVFYEGINHIKTNVERISNIVSTMRSLFHGDNYLIEKVELYNYIKPIVYLFKDKAGKVEYEINISDKINIYTNKSALNHILMNILTNAIESIEDEGKIKISSKENDGKKELIITDNGCGIPDDVLDKIFDFSFTTKKEKGGTGLGLYITKELADRLNIKIDVKSKVNEGTEIKLAFIDS